MNSKIGGYKEGDGNRMDIYKVKTPEQEQYFMFQRVAEAWAQQERDRIGEASIEVIDLITRARA